MGTFIHVELSDPVHFKPIFSIFKKYDELWSTYKPKSEISLINARKTNQLSLDSVDLLNKASLAFEETGSYFNVAQGSGVNLKGLGYKLEGKTIKLSKKIKLDFGGIAKGYAVDQSIDYLVFKSVKKARVSASGDIACLGACIIEIQHPFREGSLMSLVAKARGVRVSTSGSYRKYESSSRNHHIKNFKSGKASKLLSSLTLFSFEDSTRLDALATGLFAIDSSDEFYKRLNQLKNISYVLVKQKGEVEVAKNIYDFVESWSWVDTKDLKIKTKTPKKKN